jgi:hypothetical protein
MVARAVVGLKQLRRKCNKTIAGSEDDETPSQPSENKKRLIYQHLNAFIAVLFSSIINLEQFFHAYIKETGHFHG